MCNVPMRTPGGKPVTEMPGLNPRSPVMLLAPAFVTVEAPRTANTPAAPRFGAVSMLICSAAADGFLMILDARTGADRLGGAGGRTGWRRWRRRIRLSWRERPPVTARRSCGL